MSRKLYRATDLLFDIIMTETKHLNIVLYKKHLFDISFVFCSLFH